MASRVLLCHALLATLAYASCKLGDPSVYDRANLGDGSALDDPNDHLGGSSSSTSSSSSGALDDGSAPDADVSDAAPDAAVACTPFAPPAATPWTYEGNAYHYHLDAVVIGELTGVLKYGVVPSSALVVPLEPTVDCPHAVGFESAGRYFFQRSGTSSIAAIQACGSVQAELTDLILEEITYDGSGNTVPVPGGPCFSATGPIQVTSSGACE